MAGKTKAQKEQEKSEIEEKKKTEAKRIAEKQETTEKAEIEAKEIEKKNAGFIEEVTVKIADSTSIENLNILSERVYDIWADNVPAVIQDLAAKKAEEIEAASPDAPKTIVSSDLQKDWVKVTMVQVKEAEKAGKLAGFDDKTMTAKINK